MLGARWKEDGVPFARCKRFTIIAKGPEDQAVLLCFSCYTQDLERARAVEELKRVQMEVRGREEVAACGAKTIHCLTSLWRIRASRMIEAIIGVGDRMMI